MRTGLGAFAVSAFSWSARSISTTGSRPFALMAAGSEAAGVSTYVVGVDGDIAPSMLSSKQFLLESPNGAYTTARSCGGGKRLFEWDTHVQRTAQSAEAMLREAAPANLPMLLDELGSVSNLKPRLEATVSGAMREYLETHGSDHELKVTVLVSWPTSEEECATAAKRTPGGGGSVACHVAQLPPLPSSPVRVEVRGAPRENAAAKDSSWVADRAPLEALMRNDINELLLTTASGELVEGSQTNFYAIRDGVVYTAGEGVLAGTVRRLLLEVCEREGVPVVLSPPKLEEVGDWEAALISSTSRLLLPIDELYVPSKGKMSEAADLRRSFDNSEQSLARKLQDLVQGEVLEHSSELL